MMPIKVLCGCGQKYAFDIEPVNGRMPMPVACPVCGADGTAAANEIIAQNPADAAPGGRTSRTPHHCLYDCSPGPCCAATPTSGAIALRIKGRFGAPGARRRERPVAVVVLRSRRCMPGRI